MARGDNLARDATAESRAKGGKVKAENARKRREEAERLAVEALADKLNRAADVLIEGMEAEGVVVVKKGDDQEVVYFPHHGIRIRAADKVFDRIIGRPAQRTEHSGHVDINLNARELLDARLAALSERRGTTRARRKP